MATGVTCHATGIPVAKNTYNVFSVRGCGRRVIKGGGGVILVARAFEPRGQTWRAAAGRLLVMSDRRPPPHFKGRATVGFGGGEGEEKASSYQNHEPRCMYRMAAKAGEWGRGDLVVRLLASHQGELGSIPGGVYPGFLHEGIVSFDATGRRVFSGIFRFSRPSIPMLLRTRLASPSSTLKTSMLRAAQISSLTHFTINEFVLLTKVKDISILDASESRISQLNLVIEYRHNVYYDCMTLGGEGGTKWGRFAVGGMNSSAKGLLSTSHGVVANYEHFEPYPPPRPRLPKTPQPGYVLPAELRGLLPHTSIGKHRSRYFSERNIFSAHREFFSSTYLQLPGVGTWNLRRAEFSACVFSGSVPRKLTSGKYQYRIIYGLLKDSMEKLKFVSNYFADLKHFYRATKQNFRLFVSFRLYLNDTLRNPDLPAPRWPGHQSATALSTTTITLHMEEPCAQQGGQCLKADECPEGKLSNATGLCPKQQSLGVECCHGQQRRNARVGETGDSRENPLAKILERRQVDSNPVRLCYVGNTARLARRSDEALGARAGVVRIARSLPELGRGVPTGVHSTLKLTLANPQCSVSVLERRCHARGGMCRPSTECRSRALWLPEAKDCAKGETCCALIN
ncbi:hypothetical protein PR048_022224 [Dryococelus australis]|uniref:Uncharacterized protein n=1 Tax=Dryococelus australis TaxID=614101 RepID=A0ABQ9H0D8_9NEOP|nr:hypothetical protein PR048_022224 [Dryococelus australis]